MTQQDRRDGIREPIPVERDEWEATKAEVERLREQRRQATLDFAALLRSHTRAIWALKGEGQYPEEERQAMGAWASECLQFMRLQAEADAPQQDQPQPEEDRHA